ncbi:CBS domain-containing protein [Marinobacter sp. X15-166B]|uniref:CBS domain-containing protein n=1 Tax=Marinobacter sp. X15-166B TaxID=1897620 RepID=UPI00085BDA1C|nr:CBS domain-containing protein [Marinobacter sp. X15-166B]OEY67411.1 hypothetical protein BG841_13840 [Marinobacter sp. X15-166B]
MAIFVSEPGRPRGIQVVAANHRPVASVTAGTPAQASDPKNNQATDAGQNARHRAQRAVAGYGGVVRVEPEEHRPYLPVADLATPKLVTLSARATMADALTTMARNSIHHLLLTDRNDIAGLISADWILRWLYQRQARAALQVFNEIELPAFLSASPETDAHDLARLMLAHQLRAALILDQAALPVGIVTASDYLQLYAEAGRREGNA